MSTLYHYPVIAGYARKRGKRDKSEPLFGKVEPRRDQVPVTLCGRTKGTTRTYGIDCEACKRILDKYPQLGNALIEEHPALLSEVLD